MTASQKTGLHDALRTSRGVGVPVGIRRSFCVANVLAQAFARTRARGLLRPAWKEDVCPLSCALMARS